MWPPLTTEFAVIFSCLLHLSLGTAVDFEYANDSGELNSVRLQVDDSEITGDLLQQKNGFYTKSLKVHAYSKRDFQFDFISELPYCENITISSTGQKLLPTFENLPRLKVLKLNSNVLVYVKRDAFSTLDVESIFLDQNSIFTVEDSSFGMKVRQLSLACNKINSFSSKWFKNVTSLEALSLTGNYIKTIEANAFKGFLNLITINLELNSIYLIGNGAFDNRNIFENINLNSNELKQLPTTLFSSGKIKISNFAAKGNLLTFLSEEFMDKVNVTKSATLNGNPWQCPCYDSLRSWIDHDIWVKGPDDQPRCVVPIRSPALRDLCLPFLDEEIISYYIEKTDKYGSYDPVAAFCKNEYVVNYSL